MKTGLGLNFLRIVNEEGFDGWSQVYARIPLGEDELRQKGALFGVIKAKEELVSREMEEEIMMKVDQYFNGVAAPGDLSVMTEGLEKINFVWVWIYENDLGQREMKLINNNGGVWVQRGNEQTDLGVKLEDRRVIKGRVESGDRIIMWVGEMQTVLSNFKEEKGQEQIDEMVDSLTTDNKSGAALILKVEEWEGFGIKKETKDKVVIENEEPKEIKQDTESETEIKIETEKLIEERPINLETSKVYWQQEEELPKTEDTRTELVSDTYVGKVGPKERLINWWKRRKGDRRDLGVGEEHIKRKKWAGLMGVIFLLLLVVSVGVGTIKIKSDREQKKWSEFYEPIEKKRQEAVGLVDINIVGARKLMEEVKTEYAAGKDQFEQTRFKGELGNLDQKIEETWLIASGEKPTEMNTKLDVGLVREGFSGQRMERLKESNFLVLDGQMGVLIIADSATKEIKVSAGKGLGWIDAVFDGKKNVILDGSGLVSGDGTRLLSFDSVVGKPVALGVFGSNIYVLDQSNKEIYKYVSGESVMGERTRWLKEGQSMSAEPVDLAMDSDIWILEKDNNLERFRRGSRENFNLSGVPEKMSFSRVAVEIDGDRIALLDPDKGMVVIFSKADGGFKEQLKITSVQRMADLEFDGTGGLWVLAGGVIGKVK